MQVEITNHVIDDPMNSHGGMINAKKPAGISSINISFPHFESDQVAEEVKKIMDAIDAAMEKLKVFYKV
jgi:hypothetical protein